MNTLEIDTLLKKHPHSRPVFRAVYARNRLPRPLRVPSVLVGNTDPDHQIGQHWVAIYIDANSRGEYYDPTGCPPHESAYVNFIGLTISFEYKKKDLPCADIIAFLTSFIVVQDIA
jgi:hypothetical protein